MKRRIIVLGISCLISLIARAQGNELPQVFSPNAAELGKYGRIPVNYFTGLPNITIPLTEVKAKNYTLPIYLSYHASGNKPEQHPGWVGQGWTLHAGGCINRIIRGKKDEMSEFEFYRLSGGYVHSDPGYIYHATDSQGKDWNNESVLIQDIYYENLSGNPVLSTWDREPDEFQVNIDDIQASFYFISESDIRIISKGEADFTVSYEIDTTALRGAETLQFTSTAFRAAPYSFFKSFVIRKNDGTRYYFGGDFSSIEFSAKQSPIANYSVAGAPMDYRHWIATANTWMLKKIELPDNEVIIFEYENDGYPIIRTDYHNAITYTISGISIGPASIRIDTRDTPVSQESPLLNIGYHYLRPLYLKSISVSSTGECISFSREQTQELEYPISGIEFERQTGLMMSSLDYPSDNYYMKLSSITNNMSDKKIFFSYTNNTGTRLKLLSLVIRQGYNEIYRYAMEYNPQALPSYNSHSSDLWGYNLGWPYSLQNDQIMGDRSSIHLNDEQAEILVKLRYPTGGWTEFEYSIHDYSKIASQFPFSVEDKSGTAGGLRISKMKDYSGTSEFTERRFEYKDTSNKSSGILAGVPLCFYSGFHYPEYTDYYYFGDYLLGTESGHYNAEYQIFTESPINELSLTNGAHVTYGRVEEVFTEGGSIIYEFTNHDSPNCMDAPPALQRTRIVDNSFSNPLISKELYRGLLVKREVYNDKRERLVEERNVYCSDTTEYIQSLVKQSLLDELNSRVSLVKLYNGFPALTRKTVTTYPDGDGVPVVETTDYEWNDHRQLVRTVRSVSVPENESVPSDTLVEERFYARDYQQSGFEGVDYPAMTAMGMGGVPVETVVSRGGKLVSAELTEWKYDATSGCYLPYRRSTASPSEYAYTGGGLYNGSTSNSPYSLPEYAVMSYDAKSNPREIYLKDGRYGAYTWDEHCRLRGRFIGARGDRLVQLDHYVPESVYKEIDLTNHVDSYYEYGFTTCSDSLCRVNFNFTEGNETDLWGMLDSISFRYYASSLSPGELPQSVNEEHFLPSGNHYVLLSTHSIVSVPPQQSPLQPNEPVGPEEPVGPDHPGWTEPDPALPNPLLRGTLRLYYRDLVNHPYYEAWSEMRHFSFEGADSDSVGGFESDGSRVSPFSFTATFDPGKCYVIDMMVRRNGTWEYERRTFALSPGGGYTLYADGLPFDEVRIYPEGADVETYTWWGDGNLRSRTDGRGVTESYEYDGLGRLTAVRDNAGHKVDGYEYRYATRTDPIGI